jgi:hypothetical protein
VSGAFDSIFRSGQNFQVHFTQRVTARMFEQSCVQSLELFGGFALTVHALDLIGRKHARHTTVHRQPLELLSHLIFAP